MEQLMLGPCDFVINSTDSSSLNGRWQCKVVAIENPYPGCDVDTQWFFGNFGAMSGPKRKCKWQRSLSRYLMKLLRIHTCSGRAPGRLSGERSFLDFLLR